MKRTTLTIEFTTPCFLGGANQESAAEWRAMSIRGELRWWFRALAKAKDTAELAKMESEVFGNTTRKSPLEVRVGAPPRAIPRGGVLQYGTRLSEKGLGEEWKDSTLATLDRLRLQQGDTNPLAYLGYGCIGWRPRIDQTPGFLAFERSFIAPNATATITFQWPGNASPPYPDVFHDAVWAWIHLGGIGAKHRRGFGSLACREVDDGSFDPGLTSTDRETFVARAGAILEGRRELIDLPAWPRLSLGSRVFLGREGKASWAEAMTLAGAWLIAFRRRYGNPNDTRTYSHGPIANRDYDWAAQKASKLRGGLPDRAGFGLPLPFGKLRDDGTGPQTVVLGDGQADGRSASPLHLHIEKFGDGSKAKFFPVWTYLPNCMLPVGQLMRFKQPKRRADRPPPRFAPDPTSTERSPHQASIVNDFLDDLASPKKNLIEEVK